MTVIHHFQISKAESNFCRIHFCSETASAADTETRDCERIKFTHSNQYY